MNWGNIAMIGATVAVAGLTWRLIRIAKGEGPASLLTSHVDEALLHVCLVFAWVLFVREGLDVLWHANRGELMAGYGALFGGLLATCLARMRNRPASIASEAQNG